MINRFHKILLKFFGLIFLEVVIAIFTSKLRWIFILMIILETLIVMILPVIRKRGGYKARYENNDKDTFIKLNSGYVRYKLMGQVNDPLVILINGFPMPYEIWDKNIEKLVNSNYRVLQFDFFGLGYSEYPKKDKVNFKLYCRQISELVDKLNITSTINVVAFSAGCSIAAKFIESYPKYDFGKVVFIGPMVKGQNISPFNWPFVGEYFTSIFMGNALNNIFYSNFNKKIDLDRFKEKFFNQKKLKSFYKGWLSFYRTVFPEVNFKIYEGLKDKKIMVHIICGKEDKVVPLEDSLLLKESFNWPVEIVEDGGHAVQYDCYEKVNLSILKFLSQM